MVFGVCPGQDQSDIIIGPFGGERPQDVVGEYAKRFEVTSLECLQQGGVTLAHRFVTSFDGAIATWTLSLGSTNMTVMTPRAAVVAHLLDELEGVCPQRRALVALDGFDGVGKTHLSCELIELSRERGGRHLERLSIDGFHRPRAERVAAGTGPEGFYRGSYRYDTFKKSVVQALHSGRSVLPAVWDVDGDRPVEAQHIDVPQEGILLVDGIFLQRPELDGVWDAVVWVDAPLSVSVPRGNARLSGKSDPDPEAPSNRRYVEGQRLYVAEAQPRLRATWIFDNTDLDLPKLSARRPGVSPERYRL